MNRKAKRVLVTWGSKMGGTEGIGRILGQALEAHGLEVVAASVEEARTARGFDAVIVGGGLYGNRWPASARRFVRRNVAHLRTVPVWLFSSGPLDDSADRLELAAPTEIAVLGERVGALGHRMFGGRLAPDAKGFPASAMAKDHSGDWRNPDRIRAWAATLATEIPHATPGRAIDHPARSLTRVAGHAFFGWALCAVSMIALERMLGLTATIVLHAILAPLVFLAVAHHYFGARGARGPLHVAIAFTVVVAVLDLAVVAGAVHQSIAMFGSIAGTWLPFALIFATTWITGALMATLPWPKPERAPLTPRSPSSSR